MGAKENVGQATIAKRVTTDAHEILAQCDVSQFPAIVERSLFDVGDLVAKYHIGQLITFGERIGPNARDAVRYLDLRQAGAGLKSIIANESDLSRQGKADKLVAPSESTISYLRDLWAKDDVGKAVAAAKCKVADVGDGLWNGIAVRFTSQ